MNRNPIVGDVISFLGKKKYHVVVEAGMQLSEDRLRGDTYSAYVFKTIAVDETWSVPHGQSASFNDPKEYTWHVEPASTRVATPVTLTDIVLRATVAIKPKVVKTYDLKKWKDV